MNTLRNSVDNTPTFRDTEWGSDPLFVVLKEPMLIALAQSN